MASTEEKRFSERRGLLEASTGAPTEDVGGMYVVSEVDKDRHRFLTRQDSEFTEYMKKRESKRLFSVTINKDSLEFYPEESSDEESGEAPTTEFVLDVGADIDNASRSNSIQAIKRPEEETIIVDITVDNRLSYSAPPASKNVIAEERVTAVEALVGEVPNIMDSPVEFRAIKDALAGEEKQEVETPRGQESSSSSYSSEEQSYEVEDALLAKLLPSSPPNNKVDATIFIEIPPEPQDDELHIANTLDIAFKNKTPVSSPSNPMRTAGNFHRSDFAASTEEIKAPKVNRRKVQEESDDEDCVEVVDVAPDTQESVVVEQDSHRDNLMAEKRKVMQKLESMGYDPYTGLYAAHRERLMEDKLKYSRMLEQLGYDPKTGLYAAHRDALMQDKNKVIEKMNQLGVDPYTGKYVAHRPRLLSLKKKAIKRLKNMGYDEKGRYAEHRPALMVEKEKAEAKLHDLGYDKKGMYAGHRENLMIDKKKALKKLKQFNLDPATGAKVY